MKNNRMKVWTLVAALSVTGFYACDNASTLTSNDDKDLQVGQLPENGAIIPGRYIVVTKPSDAKDQSGLGETFASILSDNGVDWSKVDHMFTSALQGVSAELNDDQYTKLLSDPRIDYIEPDRVIALSPEIFRGKPGGGGGGSTTQTIPWGITRVGGAGNGAGKTAWVIDTGIQLNHPDLNVDVARSRTFFTSGKDAKDANDGNGHGTHVAGTIAALDNTIGVVGVAAGASVVAVKVLDSRGSGSYSGVIAGVDYVASAGSSGDVANLSLGGPASAALDAAVLNAASRGIRMVLAAGNESQHAGNVSPARVNGTNVYTISAFDINGRFASFSNFGNPPVDFAEPGVNIQSTWINGGYNTISGTSMASPHAAGILLLGNIRNGGTVTNDPDGNPDVIGVR